MKKSFLIITLISALLIVLGIGIGVSAASEPSIAIKYGNIIYSDGEVTLGYAVEYDGIPSSAEHGLLVWRGTSAKHYLKGREDVAVISDETVTIDGGSYYKFSLDGIAEHELTDNVYAVAYAQVGTKIYYSEVNKHSPLRYVYIAEGKIGSTPESDERILAFLREMISAGAAAQKAESYKTDALADASFVELSLENASFSDGTSKALLPAGSLVAVTAEDAYGKVLSDWVDADGKSVAADGLEYVRVPDKNASFKPKYVDAGTGIEYDLCASDARFTSTPPTKYEFGKTLALPEPVRDGYFFAGWYTDPSYDVGTAMNTIYEGYKGDVKLYASWSKRLYLDDYTKLSGTLVDANNNKKQYTTVGKTNFRGNNNDGTLFTADGEGVIWHTGTVASDLFVNPSGGLAGFMGDDNVVTVRVSIASVAGRTPHASSGRIRVSYKNESIAIFNVSTSGDIFLGGDAAFKIGELTTKLQYVTIYVDFDRMELSAISEDGYLVARRGFSIPSSSIHKTPAEWKADMSSVLLNWYSGASKDENNAVRLGELSVYSGNYALRSSVRQLSTEDLQERIAELLEQNAAFSMSSFESKYSPIKSTGNTSMPAPVYNAAPSLYARDDGTGARLMLNDSKIAGIIATLEDEAYAFSYESLLSIANSSVDGKLGEPSLNFNGRKGLHNFNNGVLAAIEAKAFMFRILYEQDLEDGSYDAYRRDVYGYEAIVAIKNFLETMHIQYINSDQCREYGYAMFVAAEVYDWCYPLLTKKDKDEIKYAVVARCCSGTSGSTDNSETTCNGVKMEVGFPPKATGSVVGHNSEAQILRDYLAFALAIYDEDPTWWEYVAGRVVGDYVEVRNFYFQSDISQQGVSNYVHHRHYADLYSAWILKTATGENPYVNMDRTVLSVIGSTNPSEEYFFSSGDGSTERAISACANLALISSALYNNDTLYTWSYGMKNGFEIASASGTSSITLANMFIFLAEGMELTEDKYADLDVIQYNGYPLGQMITRYEWANPEAAGTYMKLGIITTSNHEHRDTGTFQIYYKGLLTSDGGKYDNYGHEHTQQYHHQTIAHNGLLVFNPAKWNYNSTSAETKWYSGGQRKPSGNSNIQTWLTDKFVMAELMGAQYGFKDDAERVADYAYIAGDITKAYESDTVAFMSRSMLTVYNDKSSDFPMYFFVFDSIEATDPSFKKTFLLHVAGETPPTVDGNVVTITNKGGKLVSHTLTDGATIEGIGGVSYNSQGKYDCANSRNYLVNGHQLIPLNAGHDGKWGRVEISIAGEKKSTFMHAMYVTDKDGTATPPTVEKIAADGIEGAIIGDVAAVFRDSTKRTLGSVSFTTTGEGKLRYYVAGLFEGSWSITVDGKACGTAMAGEGGMAVFTVPRGEVVLTPGEDIIPEGGGHIFYETTGGTLPENAPTSFKRGGGVKLPIPTNGHSVFDGWYTTPDFSGKAITEVPKDAKGEFTVYAKWRYVFVNEGFEYDELNISGLGDYRKIGNLKLSVVDGTKGEMRLKTDKATKQKYLVVSPAGGDIVISADGYKGISSINSKKITYTFELSNNSAGRSPRVACTIKGNSDILLFTVAANGALNIGNRKIATLTNELTKYSFTIDFSGNNLIVTDAKGAELYNGTLYGIDIGALESSLFELTVSDGASGSTKYNLEIGSIEVKAEY